MEVSSTSEPLAAVSERPLPKRLRPRMDRRQCPRPCRRMREPPADEPHVAGVGGFLDGDKGEAVGWEWAVAEEGA